MLQNAKHGETPDRFGGKRIDVGATNHGRPRRAWAAAVPCVCSGSFAAEPLTFRALQAACDMNPGSLNTRLKELRALHIVDHSDAGYYLTKHGRSLMDALEPLQAWANTWARHADI